MALQNVKYIGGKHFEATCEGCGEVFMFTKGDDIFARVAENGDVYPVCSKCYKGPRAKLPLNDDQSDQS